MIRFPLTNYLETLHFSLPEVVSRAILLVSMTV